jgi:sulfoxide reductase heme-binding subunit YedZ
VIAAGVTGLVPGSLAATPQLGGQLALVVTSSTPLWYITRATGVVALVLLTAGMALGLLTAVRFEGRHWPRFITIGLHRNMSLLALAFTAAHVLTTILDNFVPIDLQDAFVPFISPYRPLWLGFGAIALDLLIALTVTSLLRARLGLRTWRLVHWTAYLCWPLAVLHGLGTGSDTRTRWVLVVTLLCVAAIAGLTGWRLANGWPAHPGVRVAGAIVLVAGPLRPGWSLHAGLPALTHEQTGHQARDLVQAWDGVLARDRLGEAAGRTDAARAAALSWTGP